MLDAVQGRDMSVRGTISKGHFVQGTQHPRIFGRGLIGRGHINPASANAEVVTVQGFDPSILDRVQSEGSANLAVLNNVLKSHKKSPFKGTQD